jgi:hypothetical protein
MILIYFEGLGFLVGFILCYFFKRVASNVFPKTKRIWISGISIVVIFGWVIGLIFHFIIYPQGRYDVFLEYIMGFTFLGFPGWVVGLVLDWFIRKVSG